MDAQVDLGGPNREPNADTAVGIVCGRLAALEPLFRDPAMPWLGKVQSRSFGTASL